MFKPIANGQDGLSDGSVQEAKSLASPVRKQWGWWAGLIAALINGLLVLGLVLEGEVVVHSLFWAIVPAILLWYLFSPAGRELLKP
jgi:hypothetical protein